MINGSKVKLREKKLSDARNDFTWHRDIELSQLDAAPPLTMSFADYLLDYTGELRHIPSTSHRFAVETPDGRHIGNCSYYNVDKTKGETELGIMIGDRDYWDKGYGSDVITTLVNHIFLETNLQRIFLKTLDWNERAQCCFNKCGFTRCGQLHRGRNDFILMDLPRQKWAELRGNHESAEGE